MGAKGLGRRKQPSAPTPGASLFQFLLEASGTDEQGKTCGFSQDMEERGKK